MRTLNIIKQLFSSKGRSSAGSNCSIYRMILQALPMYLVPTGWSLPPLTLLFIVNSRCNLRCKICDIGQKNRESIFYKTMVGDSPQDMSLDAYRSIVSQVEKSIFISITSTEPLLWSPLIEAIDWTTAEGREMNITTNGLLLPKKAHDLVDAGLNKLTISLDGPSEIHNTIRGVKHSYQKAIEGIKEVAAYRDSKGKIFPRILINTVISPINQGEITRFLTQLPLNLIDQVNIELMTFCTSSIAQLHNETFGDLYPASETCLCGGINLEDMDVERVIADLKNATSLLQEKITLRFPLKNHILHNYFFLPEKFLTKGRCIFPYFTAQVNTKGDLIGLTRCYPVAFGNVLQDGFYAAWNSDNMKAFRVFLRRGERMPACSRCEGILYDL